MKNWITLTVSLLILAGCISSPPAITDYNGTSVKIAVPEFEASKNPRPQDYAEATRICSANQKYAEFASSNYNDKIDGNDKVEYLFLCL